MHSLIFTLNFYSFPYYPLYSLYYTNIPSFHNQTHSIIFQKLHVPSYLTSPPLVFFISTPTTCNSNRKKPFNICIYFLNEPHPKSILYYIVIPKQISTRSPNQFSLYSYNPSPHVVDKLLDHQHLRHLPHIFSTVYNIARFATWRPSPKLCYQQLCSFSYSMGRINPIPFIAVIAYTSEAPIQLADSIGMRPDQSGRDNRIRLSKLYRSNRGIEDTILNYKNIPCKRN